MNTAVSRRVTITAAMVVIAMLMGATLVSAGHFADVSPASVHDPGIHYVSNAGITAGCRPGEYCPRDALTRDQMATFIHRQSGNAPGIDPSVNAHRLQGFSAADLMDLTDAERVLETGQSTGTDHFAVSVSCPAGKVLLGGGGSAGPGGGGIVPPGWENSFEWVVARSYPVSDTAWHVGFRRLAGASDATGRAYAICASDG